MDKEKIYHSKDYNISYAESPNDRSCLVITKSLRGTLYYLEEFFDETAKTLATILDNYQLEVNRLANQNETLYNELETLKESYKKLLDENAFVKQLIPNCDKRYSYGIWPIESEQKDA